VFVGVGAMMLLLVAMTTQVMAQEIPNFTAMVDHYGPAVVNITVTEKPNAKLSMRPDFPPGDQFPEFFKHFFDQFPDQPRQHDLQSLGSGFIVSSDGYILTNAHVVDNSKEVTVRLSDRQELPAKVIGVDERTDIALLKVDAHNLPTVKIGDSNKLKVGEWVLAIGAPFGFDSTATQGIVSALSRSLPNGTYVPFIQTDVSVNPGNSGGPLFDSDGNVVGVNSQIYSRSGGYMGLSFAIPINTAMAVADQLKSEGHVTHGWLGVTIQDMNQMLAESFGLGKPEGALVSNVSAGSPAARGGIKTGDVILSYDDKTIERSSDLPPLVGATPVGSTAKIKILRDGKTLTLNLKVGELQESDQQRLSQAAPEYQNENRLGLTAESLSAEQRKALGTGGRGVVVGELDPEGPAAKAGLQTDDVILSFNHKDVKNVAQLNKLAEETPAGKPVVVLIMRQQTTRFLPLVIPESVG
jgi:serine protease Do